MEGDGELMKMLMQADSPDEDIQGTLGDSSMGPPGVRERLNTFIKVHIEIWRMCCLVNNAIFQFAKQMYFV